MTVPKVCAKSFLVLAFLSAMAVSAVSGQLHLKQHVFGDINPPSGFVDFCKRHSADCTSTPSVSEFVPTEGQFKKLNFIQHAVNSTIYPSSDKELYGVTEYWEYPVNAGDCEDYALRKKQLLIATGFPRNTLRLTVVLDETGAGHAVLSVLTKNMDLVLDNRRDDVVIWSETKYRFLRREATGANTRWESLEAITASN
jgi:predicted transglutaminase-like cysteine proteinase